METGSTPLIRNTAAQQLGDIQKQHPDDLFHLLNKVIPFLTSRSWETRSAAAKAIGAVVENAARFDPNEGDDREVKPDPGGSGGQNGAPDALSSVDFLQLHSLDIAAILTHGKKLLGSGFKGSEYALASLDPGDRLMLQKRNLRARLGLDGEHIEEESIEDAIATAGITPSLPRVDTSASALSGQNTVQSPSPFTALSPRASFSQTPTEESALSKRQLNQLKRKNKLNAKSQAHKVHVVDLSVRRQSTDVSTTPAKPEPSAVKTTVKSEPEQDGKLDVFSLARENIDEDTKIVTDFKGPVGQEKPLIQVEIENEGLAWPYELLCDFLRADLFDPNWEIRHGAAMGLREVIRVHGAGAGRELGKNRAINDELNNRWLDDLACRLCCVSMLDRFGDYTSDTVVAPIRETVGQTLGALISHMAAPLVHSTFRVLYRMVMQNDTKLSERIWQVCHGGMTGLKYLVALRSDLLIKNDSLVDGVVEAVMTGLGDPDDDVRAVSAATLTPIAKEFVALRPTSLDELMNIVWDCLADLRDDLSASTGSIMDLLAKLCSFPEALIAMQSNAAKDLEHSFTQLVPRLYPFLRHTITTVRSAVLRALQTFLDIGDESTKGWVDTRVLRLVFQNLLVERNDQTLYWSLDVWHELSLVFFKGTSSDRQSKFSSISQDFFHLTTQPIGTSRNPIPMDISLFMRPSGHMSAPSTVPSTRPSPGPHGEPPPKRRRRSDRKEIPPEPLSSTHNVDAPMIQGDVDLVGMDTLIRSRIFAARAFGDALGKCGPPSLRDSSIEEVALALSSPYSATPMVAAIVLEEFARRTWTSTKPTSTDRSIAHLRTVLEDERPKNYQDLLPYLRIVRSQCHSLLHAFRDHAHVPHSKLPSIAVIVQGDVGAGPSAFSISNAESIVGPEFDRLKRSLTPAQRITSTKHLDDARKNGITAIEEWKRVKAERDVRIKAAASGAIIAFEEIPKKPSALIKGLMDSVKTEENLDLQKRSAVSVASLIQHYANAEKRGPADKVITNLMKFYCMDTSETPEYGPNASLHTSILSLRKEEDRKDYTNTAAYEMDAKAARITRRGAREALDQLALKFGPDLFAKAPILRSQVEDSLRLAFDNNVPASMSDEDSKLGQDVVDGFSILRALAPNMHSGLHDWIIDLMPVFIIALRCKLSIFRYAAAKCFATICSVLRIKGMTTLVESILPLSGSIDVASRQGCVELIYHLIQVMEDSILPYVIFLIVPVLGRMSDSDSDVRLLATTTFATLVKLVPLEAGIPDPPGFPEQLLEGRDREREFMSQMLDSRKVEPFELPVAIKAELRSYQQEGVNWLAFLNRYNLHGILCDDMGLGKTLQTLCIVASDHHMRAADFEKTQSPESRHLPSLIVCPPTLSGHWQQEIATYAPFLTCLAYVGPAADRVRLKSKIGTTDIVITSYDVCRNDVDVLSPHSWNYCVLDEGHLIKNPRAKTSVAVKRLASNHRLILSGTPIQNNVLELWSLFDFLMPGFLGTEKVFLDRFAKPIAASRFGKSSSKEQEAGALAVEALHKQVLPFLLRRLKEEVLNDLPPKILQNYYCDLSDLQKTLFEDFAKKERKTLAENAGSDDKEAKQHIFQALQYMRKLCNSPSLVLKETHKQYSAIQAQLARRGSSIRDVAHAPKLTALRDLLQDCGIGVDSSGGGELATATESVSQHRALIFCQMKEMLDIVQNDVLRKLLPSVQFLRLDGSVEATKRQGIVNQFNTDPSYDVLLLTTSVGGLGLNLTGADTVIFVEHDWNPQKDIQAMDRAHRIGQKKVVNVYRLITRGTLEEKILK